MASGIMQRPTDEERFMNHWQKNLSARPDFKERIMNPTSYQTRQQQDLICLSHLRWNFVFQRPQHLMSRFAQGRRVFFVEEPIFDSASPRLDVAICPRTGVRVVTPHLTGEDNRTQVLERLLASFVQDYKIENPIAWFYTPMALEYFPESIVPSAVIYDC